MPYQLYDYVLSNGTNDILEWARSLQPAERGKLNNKLDMLAIHGPHLRPHVLAGTDAPGIQKVRVRGSVELRPLLCEGPVSVNIEFTLLAGAKEIGSVLRPKGVLEVAMNRKAEVLADPTRRKKHVRP
jgi:hypothetical protein